MNIKLLPFSVNAEKKMEQALHNVQDKACVGCISVKDIAFWVELIECRLKNNYYMLKKDMTGAIFQVSPYKKRFPGTYNGIPEGTAFTVKKTSRGWNLLELYRGNCNGSCSDKVWFVNEEHYKKFYRFKI